MGNVERILPEIAKPLVLFSTKLFIDAPSKKYAAIRVVAPQPARERLSNHFSHADPLTLRAFADSVVLASGHRETHLHGRIVLVRR